MRVERLELNRYIQYSRGAVLKGRRADPPRGPLSHVLAGAAGRVDQEPIAELRVVAVRVEQGGLAAVAEVAGTVAGVLLRLEPPHTLRTSARIVALMARKW